MSSKQKIIKDIDDIVPQTGDVLLFRNGKSLVSRLIRLLTTSDYNHAGIYLEGGYVAEALADGFKIRHYGDLKPYFSKGVDLYRKRKLVHSERLFDITHQLQGRKYGFFDLFKIVVYIFTMKKLFKEDSKRLICSEAVALVFRLANEDLFPNMKRLDFVSPSDLSNCKKLRKVW